MSAIIGCALPLTEDQFASALSNGSQYARKFAGGWGQFKRVSEQLRQCFDECQKAGITVKEKLCGQSLASLFSEEIVILFAHWIDEGDAIEFWDRPFRSEEIEQTIPGEFSGVFDLSVCHPCVLVERLKRKPHRYTIKYYPCKLLPSFWAEVYSVTFRLLRRQFPAEIPRGQYLDMQTKVVKEFRLQEGGHK